MGRVCTGVQERPVLTGSVMTCGEPACGTSPLYCSGQGVNVRTGSPEIGTLKLILFSVCNHVRAHLMGMLSPFLKCGWCVCVWGGGCHVLMFF